MSTDPILSARYRAIAILKANAGSENALLQFTLTVAPSIRAVNGLVKLEINQAVDDPGRLVLYYWWVSPTHSDAYVAGPVYAQILPKLTTLISEHSLIMTHNISGEAGST